jgi:hypothetical protein
MLQWKNAPTCSLSPGTTGMSSWDQVMSGCGCPSAAQYSLTVEPCSTSWSSGVRRKCGFSANKGYSDIWISHQILQQKTATAIANDGETHN